MVAYEKIVAIRLRKDRERDAKDVGVRTPMTPEEIPTVEENEEPDIEIFPGYRSTQED
jgi:hypothetical protein